MTLEASHALTSGRFLAGSQIPTERGMLLLNELVIGLTT
jgi:hypothetical protein